MDMGYVDHGTERDVVRAQLDHHPIEDLQSVLSPEEVVDIRVEVRATHVSDAVLDYALSLTRATREHSDLELGASPRASITLVRCAQARALFQGREYCVPDDVKALAVPALGHRVVAAGGLRLDPRRGAEAVRAVMDATEVPVATTQSA